MIRSAWWWVGPQEGIRSVLSIAILFTSRLVAQRPARFSTGALVESIEGSSLLGLEAHGAVLSLGRFGLGHFWLGGRAFVAGGGGIPGGPSSVRHRSLSPIVYVEFGPITPSTRLQVFFGLGYEY